MLATGTITSTPRTTTANSVRVQRTHAGSCWAGRWRGAMTTLVGGLHIAPAAPAFEQVDDRQHGERRRQQDDRDGRGLGVVELFQLLDDQFRGDLGAEWHVARDEDDRAVLAEGAGESQS